MTSGWRYVMALARRYRCPRWLLVTRKAHANAGVPLVGVMDAEGK